jgi:hypothetical protein
MYFCSYHAPGETKMKMDSLLCYLLMPRDISPVTSTSTAMSGPFDSRLMQQRNRIGSTQGNTMEYRTWLIKMDRRECSSPTARHRMD